MIEDGHIASDHPSVRSGTRARLRNVAKILKADLSVN